MTALKSLESSSAVDGPITCDGQSHFNVIGSVFRLDNALVGPRVVDPELGDLSDDNKKYGSTHCMKE